MQRRGKTLLRVAVLAVALSLAASSLWAAGETKFPLMAKPGWESPKAGGEATLKDQEGKTAVTINAKGLKGNQVYTVWFVNMMPTMSKAGVGQAPYSFKTDNKGTASFTATVGTAEIGKWQVLMIVRHPDGNPENMEGVKDALATELKKM